VTDPDFRFTIGHLFCGIGGKGLGAKDATARLAGFTAAFDTVGGIDFLPAACRDFEYLVGAPALCADLHELQPAQLRASWGNRAPHVVMSSTPCKGFSGLLGAKAAAQPKYVEMNRLILKATNLLCSTWDLPPPILFFENVPRIQSRGAELVAQVIGILTAHGYAVDTGNHDCGEIGELAQHRQRWFLVARHRAQLKRVIYVPKVGRVKACGEVIGPMPMPNDPASGPMHQLPAMHWKNWVRLAQIPAGGDWRDIPGTLEPGQKRRELFRREVVGAWADPAATVTGPGGSAASNVADPRVERAWYNGAMGVVGFDEPAGTVTGNGRPGSGKFSVADPRLALTCTPRPDAYGVVGWDQPAPAVTASMQVDNGRAAVADPRVEGFGHTMRVTDWNEPVGTITRSPSPTSGAAAVADPRFSEGKKKNWQQVSGVTAWDKPSPTVTSNAGLHAGAFQGADPRLWRAPLAWRRMSLGEALALDLPLKKAPPFVPLIVAEDGTWHRPLTTLELAALQSFPTTVDGKPLVLDGTSHTRWREGIGNAVPPAAGKSVAQQLLFALLAAKTGAFSASVEEVWVDQIREMLEES
jgi:site-specific DNA-cytosine methylase